MTLKTPGDGRHSPDGAGRHLAKLVEGLAALLAPGEPRPDALDPGFHGVGARWIRGFMAFGRVRHIGTVMLMMPACPESGFLERAARPR